MPPVKEAVNSRYINYSYFPNFCLVSEIVLCHINLNGAHSQHLLAFTWLPLCRAILWESNIPSVATKQSGRSDEVGVESSLEKRALQSNS